MNADIIIIESEGTSIGVTKSMSGGTMIVLEDVSGRIWADLDKSQVKKLIDSLTEQL